MTERRCCQKCQDADLLLLSGETLEVAAARMGMKWGSLHKHLRGHGRDDLVDRAARLEPIPPFTFRY